MATKKTKKKQGRKPWEPTEAQVAKAVEMKKYFASDRMVYMALGVAKNTFIKYKEENKDFADLLTNSGITTIFSAGMEMTKLALEKKQYLPLSFVLKAKGGWMDDGSDDAATEDNDFNLKLID